jgi:outer membrane protein TolC
MPAAHRAHLEWNPQRLIDWGQRIGPATAEVVTRLLAGMALAAPAAPAAVAQAPAPVRLTFADAVRRAAAEAPAVLLAGARTDEAEARVRQARSALLPGISATAGWVNRTFNKNSLGIQFPTIPGQTPIPDLVGPFDIWDARVQVRQSLVDFSSVARTRAAGAQVGSAQADSGAISEAAAQLAALAYLRAARARAVVVARQADSSIAAELLGFTQAQKAAGVSAAIDVTRAETQLVAAQGALVVARNQSDRARLDLARALGMDPATPIELVDSLSSTLAAADLPADPGAETQLGLARRPDLQAEVARGDAAHRTAGAIGAERLPRIDLAADYGGNGSTVGSVIRTGQVGVQVTLPILDGLRREARQAEQEAVAREADIRSRDLRQQITADVNAAFLDLGAAGAQGSIAAERLRLADQELAQARDRFQAGVAGNIEVIEAQSSLVRARDADVDARFAAATARVSLARSVGMAKTLR